MKEVYVVTLVSKDYKKPVLYVFEDKQKANECFEKWQKFESEVEIKVYMDIEELIVA